MLMERYFEAAEQIVDATIASPGETRTLRFYWS